MCGVAQITTIGGCKNELDAAALSGGDEEGVADAGPAPSAVGEEGVSQGIEVEGVAFAYRCGIELRLQAGDDFDGGGSCRHTGLAGGESECNVPALSGGVEEGVGYSRAAPNAIGIERVFEGVEVEEGVTLAERC